MEFLAVTLSSRSDRDSGLPSRASSSSYASDDPGSPLQQSKRMSEPTVDPVESRQQIRPISWHESGPQLSNYSSAELADIFNSERQLRRVSSVIASGVKRTGSARRVRRCSSAREGGFELCNNRPKIKRSISERGANDDDYKCNRRHHHHHRQGSRKGSKTQPGHHSEYSLTSLSDRSGSRSANKSSHRHKSVSKNIAVELGLATSPEVTLKESNRRRVAFAVVLISLAILIASVFLVAITLLLSPAVDAAMRKENEVIHKVIQTDMNTVPVEGYNQTVAPTSGYPG